MLNTKLTPAFYVRRALRAKNPTEFMKAWQGLLWFIDNRTAYVIDECTKNFTFR